MNPTTLKCLLALIKAQGCSSTRDLIVHGILKQRKSNAEAQLNGWENSFSVNCLSFSRRKKRAAEQGCEMLCTPCCTDEERGLSSWWGCKASTLVAAPAPPVLNHRQRHPAGGCSWVEGRVMSSNHISVGLCDFSDHKSSQNILGFYMLSTVRLRVIKCVAISILYKAYAAMGFLCFVLH